VVDIKQQRASKVCEGVWMPYFKHAPQSLQEAYRLIGKRLGGGTSRTVFEFLQKTPDGSATELVIKFSKSPCGRSANLKEVQGSFTGYQRIPVLFGYHPTGDWIVVERLKPLRSKEDLQSTMETNGVILNSTSITKSQSVFKDDLVEFCQTNLVPKWLQELLRLGVTDLGYRNWGVRESTGELVLLDYGG